MHELAAFQVFLWGHMGSLWGFHSAFWVRASPHPFCVGHCLEFTSRLKMTCLLPHAMWVLRVHPWRSGTWLLAQGPLL